MESFIDIVTTSDNARQNIAHKSNHCVFCIYYDIINNIVYSIFIKTSSTSLCILYLSGNHHPLCIFYDVESRKHQNH